MGTIYERPIEKAALWRPGTTLLVGDSLLFGIDEKRLRNTKVRIFPGASIEDMYFNLVPLLRKKPTNIILLVGTNNAVLENSVKIYEKLLRLKEHILKVIPDCHIILSKLIVRDDIPKARQTVIETNELLSKLDVPMMDNGNITEKHLAKKKLHLSSYGIGLLALNVIKILKRL